MKITNINDLRLIIRECIASAKNESKDDPRVPTQLISYEDAEETDPNVKAKRDSRDLEEMSSCGSGSVAGGPISGHFTGIFGKKRKKNK